MRKCLLCDAYTAHDSPTWGNCLATDFGWQETLDASRRSRSHLKSAPKNATLMTNRKRTKQLTQPSLFGATQPIVMRVRVGAFANSGKYGFELHNIRKLRKENDDPLEIMIDLRSLGHAWEYRAVCDPDTDVYLPPNLPLHPLIEAGRFVHAVENSISDVTFSLLLPPQQHAATNFIQETCILDMVSHIEYDDSLYETSHTGSSDNVLIPLTAVNDRTIGQLDIRFHQQFNQLAEAGRIQSSYRQTIRKLIMESAENSDSWGGGGYVAAFFNTFAEHLS